MKRVFDFIRRLRFTHSIFSELIYILSFKRARIPVPFMVLITGQKCTLRCRDCGNFTPFLPQTFYDFETLCSDIDKLFRVVKIGTLQLQGGEALVYPDLVGLLKCLKGRGVTNLVIATNGTRLLTADQIEAMIEAKVSVRISDYGIIQQRVAELTEQCMKHGISSKLYSFIAADGSWLNLGGRKMTPSGGDVTLSTYESCLFNGCLTLEDGLLARCSRGTVSHFVQGFSPDVYDLLDFRGGDSGQIKSLFEQYIRKRRPMKACSYCYGTEGGLIKPAIQLGISDV